MRPLLPALRPTFALALALGLLGSIGAPAASGTSVTSGVKSDEHENVEPDPWDAVFLTWLVGFDFSRGDYGLDDTSTLYYVPIGLIADYERWRLRLTIPFLVSEGPTTIRVGGGSNESESNRGLGEIAVSGSHLFDPFVEGLPFVELGLQVTFPTRSKRELGAGAFVFEPRIDLFDEWGPVTPFASFGRAFYTGELDDRFFASIGASVAITERLSIGASYDWFEDYSRSTRNDTPDASEIAPFLSFAISPRWSTSPYAVFGLTEGSPDYGVGLSIRFAP